MRKKCYQVFLNNLIIRRRHGRIMGINNTAQPIVNRDFLYVYYHLERYHVPRKTSVFAQHPVVFVTPRYMPTFYSICLIH